MLTISVRTLIWLLFSFSYLPKNAPLEVIQCPEEKKIEIQGHVQIHLDRVLQSRAEHCQCPALGHTPPPALILAPPGVGRKKNVEEFSF